MEKDKVSFMLHNIDLREIFERAHLKFTVSGRSDHEINLVSCHAKATVRIAAGGHEKCGLGTRIIVMR